MPGPRLLPIEPALDAFVRSRAVRDGHWMPGQQTKGTEYHYDGEIARLVGVDRVTVMRWRQKGCLTIDAADRLACALDLHPIVIWGDDYVNLPISKHMLGAAPPW